MTTRARRTAAFAGILLALALPKKTPCLAPRTTCELVDDADGRPCTPTDIEPLGIFALEWVVGRDLGLQYSRRRLDCM